MPKFLLFVFTLVTQLYAQDCRCPVTAPKEGNKVKIDGKERIITIEKDTCGNATLSSKNTPR